MDKDAPTGAKQAGAEAQRCGFVAIIGPSNSGQSTRVNALVGVKVTIVSHKVQTTRVPIRGIAIEGASQLVFVDTPGIFRTRRRLDRAMVEAAWSGAADADVVALVVDATKGVDADLEPILEKLAHVKAPRLLVINKIDRVRDKKRLLALAAELTASLPFERVFMVAALTGDGVADLRAHLARMVPEGPWLYPEDELSDLPLRLLAAEITREKIYRFLHDELPYATTVETDSWKELKDGSIRIDQTIFVARDTQKSIVLGKGGQTIKKISSEARAELADILGQAVHLFLFVKVREGWDTDPERYRELGLEFPKE
jgi:GTP-binding protein Era